MRQQLRQKRMPIFSRPLSRKPSTKNLNSSHSAILPDIFTKQLRNPTSQLLISNQNDLRRQLVKILTFKKSKVTCLQPSLYRNLHEQIQAVSYSHPQYLHKLNLVNQILASCDLSLKQRDIMLTHGQKSQAQYIFFTNSAYHPHSLCCEKPVLIKCIEKKGIQVEKSKPSGKLQIICSGCMKILLKLRQNIVQLDNKVEIFQKRRRLLDFSLHIASGRYKKHLMEDDPASLSYEHVKSRFSKGKMQSLN